MPRSVNVSIRQAATAIATWSLLKFFLAIGMVLVVAGCGYQLDSPHLPNNASRLSIAPVQNETTTGELDIRLQQFLRARLQRHTSFDLVSPDRSDLSLEVSLSELKITRARNLASANVSSIAYDLRGDASLLDRRSGKYYFLHTPVQATSRLDFDAPVVETPAIRDEGLTGALDKLAQRIETLVTLGF